MSKAIPKIKTKIQTQTQPEPPQQTQWTYNETIDQAADLATQLTITAIENAPISWDKNPDHIEILWTKFYNMINWRRINGTHFVSLSIKEFILDCCEKWELDNNDQYDEADLVSDIRAKLSEQ